MDGFSTSTRVAECRTTWIGVVEKASVVSRYRID